MTATVHTPQNSNRADRFAIIIPVYNHGKTVADVARGCLEWDLPVYVVDDGSTDDTYANIKTVEGVRILRHDHNKGKGAALIYGMTEAAGVADWAISACRRCRSPSTCSIRRAAASRSWATGRNKWGSPA